MKNIFTWIILLLIIPLAARGQQGQEPPAAQRSGKASGTLQLSPSEETWRQEHPVVRVGMSPVVPPLKFTDKGVIKGIEPDYLDLLSDITGIEFLYVIEDFSTMDAKVKSGDIDMFISFYIPERSDLYDLHRTRDGVQTGHHYPVGCAVYEWYRVTERQKSCHYQRGQTLRKTPRPLSGD